MSRNPEDRKRKRKAERDVNFMFLEENASLLADLSVIYQPTLKKPKSFYTDSFIPSQDCSLQSASEDLANTFEDLVSVDCFHDNVEFSQQDDSVDSGLDISDSDEFYKDYFDYGVCEDDAVKLVSTDKLVIHQLDRHDVSPDVWRIITGEKAEPSPEEILKSKLTQWAFQFKSIPRNAVDSLLHILHDHGHPDLPLCSKTLLKTPRNLDKQIRIVAGGQFWYRGILEALLSVITEEYLLTISNDEIEMDVFVDGISPYKSVKRHLWPIAGCLKGHQTPFVIAMWCGPSKDPLSVDEFLHDFIEEYKSLTDGFSFKSKILKVKIRYFIADAPARAWLRKVNQHGSYYSCERCTIKGEWAFNRMTYDPACEATLRTDESFKEQTQPQYHKGNSTLLSIGINMVSQFPLDIMHLVYLGTMKRLLSMLLKTKGSKFKLSQANLDRLDRFCTYLYNYVPAEFARKPRPLSEWSLYKATEFRRILLYDGFLIFKMQNHKEVYNCYLLLACAMRILLDPELRIKYAEDAHELLVTFVSYSYDVLSAGFVVYNIHHLINLFQDVILHGDPDSFSCFKYENSLRQIKCHLLAPGRTLQQIMCRMIERSLLSPSGPSPVIENRLTHQHRRGPVLNSEGKQYKMIQLATFIIQIDSANSCVLTTSGDVVIILNIIETNSEAYFIGRKFINKCSSFDFPLESSLLNIFEVSQLGPMFKLGITSIRRKVVLLPLHETENGVVDWEDMVGLCIPMLHGNT